MASERVRNLYDHKSSRRRMAETEPHERERGGGDASMSQQGARHEAARRAGRGQVFRERDYGPHDRHEVHARHRREREEMHQRHHQEREHMHHQQSLEHENLVARHEDEHETIRHRHAMEERQDQSGEGGAAMNTERLQRYH